MLPKPESKPNNDGDSGGDHEGRKHNIVPAPLGELRYCTYFDKKLMARILHSDRLKIGP